MRKLRYEIVPGFQSTAILYEPENLQGKVPAILNVNGHVGPPGKSVEYKQKRCITFARRGILALSLEWLSFGELTNRENLHLFGAHLDLVGTNELGLFYLAMRKGLDFLYEHPNTDRERLGTTGLRWWLADHDPQPTGRTRQGGFEVAGITSLRRGSRCGILAIWATLSNLRRSLMDRTIVTFRINGAQADFAGAQCGRRLLLSRPAREAAALRRCPTDLQAVRERGRLSGTKTGIPGLTIINSTTDCRPIAFFASISICRPSKAKTFPESHSIAIELVVGLPKMTILPSSVWRGSWQPRSSANRFCRKPAPDPRGLLERKKLESLIRLKPCHQARLTLPTQEQWNRNEVLSF
jgi:hypothetical protein